MPSGPESSNKAAPAPAPAEMQEPPPLCTVYDSLLELCEYEPPDYQRNDANAMLPKGIYALVAHTPPQTAAKKFNEVRFVYARDATAAVRSFYASLPAETLAWCTEVKPAEAGSNKPWKIECGTVTPVEMSTTAMMLHEQVFQAALNRRSSALQLVNPHPHPRRKKPKKK